MDTAKSLNDLSKVYLESVYSNEESVDEAAYPGYDEKGNPLKKEPKDNRHVVTYADKKANTPAYQKFKAGNKNYKKADHLNNEEFIYRLEESGKFSVEEIQTILEAEVNELYKGKHGQSEKEYQAGRSDAGKRISGDEKHGPASYTRRGVVDQKPTKPGEKPEHTPKLGSAEKNELAYRKSRLKKEEVQSEERKEVKAPIQEPKEKLKKPSRSDRVAYHPPGPNSARRSHKLEQVEVQREDFINKLIESGKFSDEEIEKIVEAQVARNDPEKYERDQEKKDTRSKKQKRMDDPHIGINSPAFKKFMQQQGM